MKKTLIVLMATLGITTAQAEIIQYDAQFTTNTKGSPTSTLSAGEANIWLGEDELTIDSWVMEFTMDSTTLTTEWSKNVFSTTNRSDASYRPLGMMIWQGIDAGMTVQKSHYSNGVTDMKTGDSKGFLGHYNKDTSFPLTMRLAYDDSTDNIYLYDVTNSVGIMGNVSGQDNLQTALVSGVDGTASTSTSSIFFANAAGTPISNVKVWDVADLAGQAEAFKSFVMNPSVPEPTTGALSLLALAGLCIRRRK